MVDVRPSEVLMDGRYNAETCVQFILAGENKAYFKTPTNPQGGDIIWRYEDSEGIWKEDGIPWVEKQLEISLNKKLKARYLSETIRLFEVATYISPENFLEDEDTITLLNGEYNIKTGQLEDFDPDHNHKNRIPINFKPQAECPLIIKFLKEILPGDLNTLQEWFGYHLWKTYRIQKLFVFVGVGANGKSTLLNLLTKFLGEENTSHVSLYELTANRFSKAELHNRLANIVADISTDEIKRTGAIKELTGEDIIRAEKKNQNAFYFRNYAKLTFSCNQLPITPDESEAFFRRFMVLQFMQIFDEAKADTNLLEKLRTPEELSGLFNWALIGLQRLIKNGRFSASKTAADMKELYTNMADPITAFINNCINEEPEDTVIKDDLYRAYFNYCKNNGFIPTANNKFGGEFKARCYVKDTQKTQENGLRARCWSGASLRCTGCTRCTGTSTSNQNMKNQFEYRTPVQPVHPVQILDEFIEKEDENLENDEDE